MNLTRTFFKPSEDAMIIKWRKKRPDAPWSEIAKKIKGKTAKQCNDRYNKHLKHVRNDTPWTAQEDQKLDELVNLNGHNWVLIASNLGNRSNIEVKNRWTVLNRNKNKKERDAPKFDKPNVEQSPPTSNEDQNVQSRQALPKPTTNTDVFMHDETPNPNFFERFEIVTNTHELWDLFDKVSNGNADLGDFGYVPMFY
ncbi:Myb-like DNA-binding domain containing protein [Trichomonas vaginalis G3]|uniref:Myb-like DNA-binding domain containing protein n=1 Tax=Trichomonas vaginalis (strain ATCC PRA-98 / G3) TaxID=412133 RepID=A2DAA8_TRIV3|nr:RNA polymerase II transcription regulator recruiting protein [Trichomonas vaginalis G3]EAY22756.1 Myb-like DNA-binding domain containing protein [Trichomonas vaginalis G3]KAI5525567.1 RNA polymerase II transcription regulator recruiting protein [Trichomonas vaginalis G3]|eukprot:XP_001583742.1 Myb-like DNA-binding domain containing protein [Trichomonas vaginalis G3]